MVKVLASIGMLLTYTAAISAANRVTSKTLC